MVFAHDTEEALTSAAVLVNTAHEDPDPLSTVAQLDTYLTRWGWTGKRAGTRAELDAVRQLRGQLRELWFLDEAALVSRVNQMLDDADAVPQLVKHDNFDWHLHATPSDAPLETRMAVEAAMAMVDVIRAGELSRLTECAADDCRDVVVDLSKNRSRRYCDSGCGNRANVAAYRARQSGQ